MKLKVSRYYEIVTEASAEDGEAEETGEVYTDQEMSIRETIREIRNGGFTEPSSSHVHAGVWLSTSDPDLNYRTGEATSESLHFTTMAGQRLSAHQTRRLLHAAGVRIR